MSGNPQFLCVEIASEHANQIGFLRDIAGIVRAGGGTVLAYDPPGKISCLEPGTIGAGMMLASWNDGAALQRVAHSQIIPKLGNELPKGAAATVLQVNGLPAEGLPQMMEIPTVASVTKAPPRPRNALMVIRGRVFDQPRVDGYRDVILPMLKERGGYYEVFALSAGEVTALHGEWNDVIFAISRWPTRAAAEDFWYSERYQKTAIPLRLNGAGRFTVNLLDAALD
jgi:uncharacterized protein (DUF1330 family)